jgi:D-alanyl-D-alanine carboxypeptidase (penicillin-binding protein 5/6)
MICIAVLACLFFLVTPHPAWALSEQDLAPNAASAVLMDAGSGTILFEKNGHKPLPPASITKVMTMLLVMEAVQQGKIKMTDMVRVSEKAASMGGTQVFLEPGERMNVQDLLKAVAIASGNDASVALAEFIGGTEEHFVQMMNEKAKQLGMKNTHFQNSNGLPEPNHYSSAHDIALMSRELLKYPEIVKFTGIYQDYLRQNTEKPFWLVNTNKLVRYYPGVDGLKTGFTSEAKFCLTATAKRGNMRLIAVVMGEPEVKTRNREVSAMLDFAFNQYNSHILYKKGDVIAERHVEKGDPATIRIHAGHTFSVLLKKGEDPGSYKRHIIWKELKAPIRKGEVIGKLQFVKDGRIAAEMELAAATEIRKASLWSTWKRAMGEMFFMTKNKNVSE